MLELKEVLYSERIREYEEKAEEARRKKDDITARMYENFAKGFSIKLEKVRLAIQASK
ncbi:MAG: hypothetical protein J6Y69_07360 [Treponema sp.]|nr:hypothetical protein [Treponema sp.]